MIIFFFLLYSVFVFLFLYFILEFVLFFSDVGGRIKLKMGSVMFWGVEVIIGIRKSEVV